MPRVRRHAGAQALTAAYDGGVTEFDLEWTGNNLTARGMPPRPGSTGIDGLVVERAYRLPDREARAGAVLVGTASAPTA